MRAIIEVDCGRYSPDHTSDACQQGGDAALGILLVAAVVLVAVGWLWWRRHRQKVAPGPAPTEAEEEAYREQLREEYRANLAAGDPATREVSRDWSDNEGTPWRVEAGMTLGLVVLFGSLAVLIPLFLVIKSLTS